MHRLLLPLLFAFAPFSHADFPTNDAYVPETTAPLSIGKAAFDRVVSRVQHAYEPILKAKLNCKLDIKGQWSDGTVNAYASRVGSTCQVRMLGGFARYGSMTEDALMNVACHEVGHHMGGLPRYDHDWASCEGQSDYWAQECMKKLLGNAPARIQRAGVVLAENLARLTREAKPSLLTPDQTHSNGVYCSHPHAQCRLDTYVNGLHNLARPRCWYNPL